MSLNAVLFLYSLSKTNESEKTRMVKVAQSYEIGNLIVLCVQLLTSIWRRLLKESCVN